MDKLIIEYLKRRRHFHETLLTVVEQSSDTDAIEQHRFAISMLDDIIHDIQVLVKGYKQNQKNGETNATRDNDDTSA